MLGIFVMLSIVALCVAFCGVFATIHLLEQVKTLKTTVNEFASTTEEMNEMLVKALEANQKLSKEIAILEAKVAIADKEHYIKALKKFCDNKKSLGNTDKVVNTFHSNAVKLRFTGTLDEINKALEKSFSDFKLMIAEQEMREMKKRVGEITNRLSAESLSKMLAFIENIDAHKNMA